MRTSFRLGFSVLLGLAGHLALTAATASEPALALAFNDAQLKWGPCPSFMPEGCEVAVLHGDPTKRNADVLFKVPAGSVIPRHWHTSAERMVMLSGELQVVYDGQPTATLIPGMYAYGPAKLPHKAYCNQGASCVLFIAFESPVDATPDSGIAK